MGGHSLGRSQSQPLPPTPQKRPGREGLGVGTPVEEEVLRVRGAGLGGELVKILWEGAEWGTGGSGTQEGMGQDLLGAWELRLDVLMPLDNR